MKFRIVLIILLTAACMPVAASSYLGSLILPRHTGNGIYEIEVLIYRDCHGTVFSPNLFLSSGQTHLVLGSPLQLGSEDITYFNKSCGGGCNDPNDTLAVETVAFRFTADLSGYANCEWTATIKGGSRDNRHDNLAPAPTYGNTSTFNKCLADPKEKTAVFGIEGYIRCAGHDVLETAFIMAEEYDSVSYELSPVLDSALQPVNYKSGFSFDKPLSFQGFPDASLPAPAGLRLHAERGTLSFRPMQTGERAIVAVSVSFWKKDNNIMQRVKQLRHEVTYVFVDCGTNNAPKVLGSGSKAVHEGEAVCFDIVTSDTDPADTVLIAMKAHLSGSTFVHNNGLVRLASGEICWHPPVARLNQPYSIYVEASDKRCTGGSRTTKEYLVHVHSYPGAERVFKLDTCTGRLTIEYITNIWYDEVGGTKTVRVLDSTNKEVFLKSSAQKKDTLNLSPGRYIILTALRNSIPCSMAYSDTITIPLCTGFPSLSQLKLRIYPNPATVSLAIEAPEATDKLLFYATDISGRKIPLTATPDGTYYITDITHLCPGYYVITALNENNHTFARGTVIKQ